MADDLAAAVQALQDILREPARAKEIAEDAIAAMVRRKMGLVVCPEVRVPVRIPALAAGTAGWAKWVIGTDPKARGGFMFEGPFLPLGQASPLPPGAVVMIADGDAAHSGKKHNIYRATAYIVQPNGELGGNPFTAQRACWDEMAERIAAYQERTRGLPLLNERRFPPRSPAPPPVPYGPPIPVDIVVAPILATDHLDGPPSP
ncbi:MAG TPA: hypothetical protein VN663_23120 [Ramlibacter sp.]|nr:hypothetical protein [Ramlibacter sp.]